MLLAWKEREASAATRVKQNSRRELSSQNTPTDCGSRYICMFMSSNGESRWFNAWPSTEHLEPVSPGCLDETLEASRRRHSPFSARESTNNAEPILFRTEPRPFGYNGNSITLPRRVQSLEFACGLHVCGRERVGLGALAVKL